MEMKEALLVALQRTGLDILEEDYDGFIVSMYENDLMFSEPQILIGEIEEDIRLEHKRFDFEQAACMYLANHDEVNDCRIMFNVAQLFILSSDRGMLRHVMNWTCSDNIKCRWDIIQVKEDE